MGADDRENGPLTPLDRLTVADRDAKGKFIKGHKLRGGIKGRFKKRSPRLCVKRCAKARRCSDLHSGVEAGLSAGCSGTIGEADAGCRRRGRP